MLNDSLANALSKIMNAEKVAKKEVEIRPSSKVIKKVLKIMEDEGYVGSFDVINNGGKGETLKLNLLGRINNCNVIKPRSSVKMDSYEKYEKRYLPAKDFGILIISTPKGIMTHLEAKSKGIGGKLLAFCY